LIYLSFRRERLCDGERECPEAVDVGCSDCGLEWQPDDIDMPGPCPTCGSQRYVRKRCPKCPLARLDSYEATAAGQLLQRAIDLKCAMKAGVQVRLGEIAEDEFRALLLVEQERDRWEQETRREST
jgi:DNA-directed RNA polymerase subunit RPC12/RpoP